jgi:hypothetical protein
MWGSVLGLALLAALHPVRLGITLLLISRPRPVQNLLAFGAGSLIVGVLDLLVPLMLLNLTPISKSFVQDLANPATSASSTARHIQLGMGVLVLSIVAFMAVRLTMRRRARVPVPASNTPSALEDPAAPSLISRLLGRPQDGEPDSGSLFRRLVRRAHDAWEHGSLWVAFVIGLVSVPLDGMLLTVAVIVTSGAAVGTQVSAAIVFLIGMLAILELILLSYWATPAKTQAGLRRLHDWTRDHRQHILIAIFAVIGISLVANGMRH